MKSKKSFKADLKNKRFLFLEIGFVAALAVVFLTFTYAPADGYRIQANFTPEEPMLYYTPIVTAQPKQEVRTVKLVPVQQILEIVPNNRVLETGITFTEFDPEVTPIVVPQVRKEEIIDDVFYNPEVMPSFQKGDINTFRIWVMQNVKFPQIALDNHISGRVVLSFVIDQNGQLTNIEVLSSPDDVLSEEAIRVLNKSPRWSPGQQGLSAVRVKYTIPLDFSIK